MAQARDKDIHIYNIYIFFLIKTRKIHVINSNYMFYCAIIKSFRLTLFFVSELY